MQETAPEELLEQLSKLERENKLLRSQRTYGLHWEKKRENVIEKSFSEIPLLKKVPELDIPSSSNLPANGKIKMIEGDNYDALLNLRYTHEGKIDLIYIDPPYNTGNKDFIYNDEYVDKDDEFRHSKWLSFMAPRLSLAWNLLKANGAVLMQIDKNEAAALRMLGDSIFGPQNYITTVAVRMSGVQGNKVKAAKDGNLVKNTEYIHIWTKVGRSNLMQHSVLYDKADYQIDYQLFIETVPGKPGQYEIRNIGEVIKDKFPEVQKSLKVLGLTDKNELLIRSKIPYAYEASSRFQEWIHKYADAIMSRDKVKGLSIPQTVQDKLVHKKALLWNNGKRDYLLTLNGTGNPEQLYSIADKIQMTSSHHPEHRVTTIRGDWWDGYYRDMAHIGKEGDTTFENGKKPLRLIEDLLISIASKNATILDFFAGSGTSAHAVLKLNHEDGGTRDCIVVTNNENNIAENICYQRIKKAIAGYSKSTSKKKTQVEGLGGSLDYYRVGHSSLPRPEQATDIDTAFAEFNGQLDDLVRLKESLSDASLLSEGEDFLLYKRDEKVVGVLLDDFNEDALVEKLMAITPPPVM